MSLDDRFHNLSGLNQQMEQERQDRERRVIVQSEEFRNRYYDSIRLVCRAFARSMGWEYEEAEDRHIPFHFNPIVVSAITNPRNSGNQSSDERVIDSHFFRISLSLTLRPSAELLGAKEHCKSAADEPELPLGGSMEVLAEFTEYFDVAGQYGSYQENRTWADDRETTTFAADADLDSDKFEALAATALETRYRRLLELCLDSNLDIGDWSGGPASVNSGAT